MTYTIELEANELEFIGSLLAERPYKEVFQLIEKLKIQASVQETEKKEAK